MHARWHFRLVGKDLSATYAAVNGAPEELKGTDLEALARARELMATTPLRVEAVSVGRPTDITDTPGRWLVTVTARADRQGWNLGGQGLPPAWYRSLEHAVSFAASCTVGYESETRIQSANGEVTHVVLIPVVKKRMTLY